MVRIDTADLNLFEFDYDLTMMTFFLSPQENVYARYGGRDAGDAESQQSLAGLRTVMNSVLKEHRQTKPRVAPKSSATSWTIRDVAPDQIGGCIHCHQARELLRFRRLKKKEWTPQQEFRFPPPSAIGVELDVDRGNALKSVSPSSAASRAGLHRGDVLTELNGVPVYSFGDAQFALDRAPWQGEISASFKRAGKLQQTKIVLLPEWKRTDIAWRRSLANHLGYTRLAGTDLDAKEKQSLGLSEQQLAFRQRDNVHRQPRTAGIQAGDVILGLNQVELEISEHDFEAWVNSRYVRGETVIVNLIRNRKRLNIKMRLQ